MQNATKYFQNEFRLGRTLSHMIRYRRPKQDDPIIYKLIKQELVPYSHLSPQELNQVILDLPKRMSRGTTLVSSFQYESDPIAFIHFMVHGKLLYIDMIAVSAQYRRQQVGKALLAHAEHFAASRSCTSSKLTVEQGNTRAERFYANFGYSRTKNLTHIQCFEMTKVLDYRF